MGSKKLNLLPGGSSNAALTDRVREKKKCKKFYPLCVHGVVKIFHGKINYVHVGHSGTVLTLGSVWQARSAEQHSAANWVKQIASGGL